MNFNELRYSYDEEYDIMYCRINESYDYDYTIPATPFFNIDISKNKKVVAFELLDASHVFGLIKNDLKDNPKVKITVQVTSDVIKIVFNILTRKGDVGSYFKKVLNENNVNDGVFYYNIMNWA